MAALSRNFSIGLSHERPSLLGPRVNPRYSAACAIFIAPHLGAQAAIESRSSVRSTGRRGTTTDLPVFSARRDIISYSWNSSSSCVRCRCRWGVTRARSSAYARGVAVGRGRRSRRSRRSAAMANSSGDSGQPCRTPAESAKPSNL
eukprot:66157-Pyramimonas_sp.AAC.1